MAITIVNTNDKKNNLLHNFKMNKMALELTEHLEALNLFSKT